MEVLFTAVPNLLAPGTASIWGKAWPGSLQGPPVHVRWLKQGSTMGTPFSEGVGEGTSPTRRIDVQQAGSRCSKFCWLAIHKYRFADVEGYYGVVHFVRTRRNGDSCEIRVGTESFTMQKSTAAITTGIHHCAQKSSFHRRAFSTNCMRMRICQQ